MIVPAARFHRMMRFVWPSTAPELYGRVNPLRNRSMVGFESSDKAMQLRGDHLPRRQRATSSIVHLSAR